MPLRDTTDLIDFDIRPRNAGNQRSDQDWGTPEIVINLLGGRHGIYSDWEARNHRPYEWVYLDREVAKRLHRQLGAFLSKEARDA